MSDNKRNKARLQVVFSALILMAVFVVEIYAMINLPKQFILIGILAIFMLICLYVLIHGIMTQITCKEMRREEQYDSIFKSEKASYLMLKKHFEEMEEMLIRIDQNAKVPTEEIIGTQKGIAKVIINRTRENADAIINSNDQLLEKMVGFESILKSNNDTLLDTNKNVCEDTVQQLLMKQQDLLMNLKDMEIRLNTAIIQNQKVLTPIMPASAAPTVTSEQIIGSEAAEGSSASEITLDAPLKPEPEAAAEAKPQPEPEPIAEAKPQPEPEPIAEAKPQPEPEPIAEAKPQPEPEPAAEAKPQPEPEPAAEAKSQPIPEVKPDLSDPNKVMSPDDIAALFANMSGNVEEAALEPAVEEAPPMPDLSDPNKQLSPDEIAALFANMG